MRKKSHGIVDKHKKITQQNPTVIYVIHFNKLRRERETASVWKEASMKNRSDIIFNDKVVNTLLLRLGKKKKKECLVFTPLSSIFLEIKSSPKNQDKKKWYIKIFKKKLKKPIDIPKASIKWI